LPGGAQPSAIWPLVHTERVTIPRPPKGAGPSGRRLWRSVQADFELGEHESALLTAMCRQVDRLDQLEALIAEEGLMVTGHGTVKVHPAVTEARQTAIAVARIGAALRLPAGEEDQDAQPGQRRGGARGVYQIHGGAA
jgi:phage terminase small subunit